MSDFAWSAPHGLDHKVRAISFATIDLDSKAESGYLRQPAHGLRLPEEVCNHIHQRYGIRPLSEQFHALASAAFVSKDAGSAGARTTTLN